jgi:hypothetical protein
LELDGVAVGLEPNVVAGLGAADQMEAPLDHDERHDLSKWVTAGTLHQHGKQHEEDSAYLGPGFCRMTGAGTEVWRRPSPS